MWDDRSYIQQYNVVAVPILLHESETWVLQKLDYSQIEAAEITFLRVVKGYRRIDHAGNENVTNDYREQWREHVNGMDNRRVKK